MPCWEAEVEQRLLAQNLLQFVEIMLPAAQRCGAAYFHALPAQLPGDPEHNKLDQRDREKRGEKDRRVEKHTLTGGP